MFFIYKVLINIVFLFSPLIVLIRLIKRKENIKRFVEKFGFFTKKRVSGKLIWFHGASVGEIQSIIPLIERLEKDRNINQILITSNTLSSSIIINKLNLRKTIHQFFPIDCNFISSKFLDYWKPSKVFFVDSEIWPNTINNLFKKNIPIILLNGRITKKTFNRWMKFSNFSKFVFSKFNFCLSANKESKKFLKKLGANNVKFFGNLKFSQSENQSVKEDKNLKKFILKRNSWCSSSTHRGEELISIKAHKILKTKYNNLLSVIIPRHVERSNELVEMFNHHNLNVHCHSWKSKIPEKTDIYLVDTYGETEKFFNLIKIVFVGGSFVDHGGQNPLEPVRHGCFVLYGPYVNTFKNIYDYLDKIKLSKKVSNIQNLNKKIKILFKNKSKSKIVVRKVKKFGNKILIKTIKEIEKELNK